MVEFLTPSIAGHIISEKYFTGAWQKPVLTSHGAKMVQNGPKWSKMVQNGPKEGKLHLKYSIVYNFIQS